MVHAWLGQVVLLIYVVSQTTGETNETIVPADMMRLKCMTVGSPYSQTFIYTAEGIDRSSYRDRADFSIDVGDEKRLLLVNSGFQNNKYIQGLSSSLTGSAFYGKVAFWHEDQPDGNTGPLRYSYGIRFNIFSLSEEFNDVVVLLSNQGLIETTTPNRVPVSLRVTFNVSACYPPPPYTSSPESCEYGCEAIIACPDGSNGITSKCQSNCKFSTIPNCAAGAAVFSGLDSGSPAAITGFVGGVVGGAVLLAFASFLITYRLKAGQWPFSKGKGRYQRPGRAVLDNKT